MKRLLFVLPLVTLTTGTAFAANTASHDVTVEVSAINELALAGGNITLTVDTATAGSEPDAATDNTTSLDWTSNEASRKITAESGANPSGATLSVTGTVDTGTGSSAGAVSLSTVAQDLVTGFGQEVGGASLDYSASATAADGTSSTTYTITYTLTAE